MKKNSNKIIFILLLLISNTVVSVSFGQAKSVDLKLLSGYWWLTKREPDIYRYMELYQDMMGFENLDEIDHNIHYTVCHDTIRGLCCDTIVFNSIILKLTEDTLILNRLGEYDSTLVFYKVKRLYPNIREIDSMNRLNRKIKR